MQSSGRPLGWRAKLREPSILPRFNLRVALVTTALVAVVTWQGGIVISRRHALTRVDRYIRGGELANPLRVLLGDEKVAWIYLHPEAADAELAKYASLFPEATVQRRER